MEETPIRDAVLADAGAILDIYRCYVEKTAVTFEWDVPSLEEMKSRMARTGARYPYLVAERNSRIVGYAYAGPFVGRTAYDWCAEMTIYLAPGERGRGTGRRLYGEMEKRLAAMGLTTLYACIGVPQKDDEYLTHQSANFHAHMGYRQVGLFENCGYKFGRWYHMIWMEKRIAPAKAPMAAVKWREKPIQER